MNILGLNLEEFCSAAIMKDGKIIAASAEERFTREKGYSGFPKQAIEYCLKEAGLKIDDIDQFAIADLGTSVMGFVFSYLQRRSHFSIADYVKEANEYWYPRLYEGKDIDYMELFKDKLCLETFPKEFNDEFFNNIDKYKNGGVEEVQELKRLLLKTHFPQIKDDQIKCYPHHEMHAFYGYYVSKFANSEDPTLVITADSWGDYENGMISKFENGKFEVLHVVDNHNLGRIYRNLTLHLGMKPYDHEYKVMGLAPYAPQYLTDKAYQVFASTMEVEDVDFVYKENPKDNYFWFKERLQGLRFDGVAGGLQKYFEDRIQKWVLNAIKKYGIRKVCLSGGLAMNIKANMILAQLDEVEDFFVAASPDDNSNCIAACFMAQYREDEAQNKDLTKSVEELDTMYLGPNLSLNEINEAIIRHDLNDFCTIVRNAEFEYMADRLADGVVIGRCSGRMEFGARSLGNRSILADPRNIATVNRINRIIKMRDFWMPFAPVVLDTHWDKYLVNKNNIFSPFMTVGFETTTSGAAAMAAGTHMADATARPQMLVREANPDYYDLVQAFEKKTGTGALLNTSFNLHGYPIVRGAEDAIHVFLNSDLDALLLNDTYIEKKERARA